MKKCTNEATTTRCHPLGALLITVVAGSAALTFTLAAMSPDTDVDRNGSTFGVAERANDNRNVPLNPKQLHDHVNQIMGLEKSELQMIDVQPDHPLEGQLEVLIDGEPMTMTYWPHSVRSDLFRVWEHLDDGSFVEYDAGPERTIRGMIDDLPGSTIAGSLLDDGLHAGFNLPDGRRLWIEPVAGRLGDIDDRVHVIYDAEDADCEEGSCGAPNHWFAEIHEDGDGDMQFSSECEQADIAFDADFLFYTWLGSNSTNVVNYIENIINAINSNQYEPQVGIKHVITEIVVRTSSASNPYTSCSANTLLNQFRNVWRTAPESSIPRDMAHLMTGCNMGGILGIAWLGTVCQGIHGNHYALSRNMSTWSCQTDLVAHETGHNWNAGHCSCPSTTMNPSITCTNTFVGGGSNSVNQILAYKNSVNCLGPCIPPDPPANNTCEDRFFVTDGSTGFTNEHATTDGPDEPATCNFFGNSQIQKDVWFEYTATCTGDLTVELCASLFSTKLGIYEGSICPTQPDTIEACDITSCPSNRSRLVLSVEEGEDFIIRVGGRTDQEGQGTLTITCEEAAPDCPADLDGNGVVDGADLLILLSSWGPCPGCPADLDGNGVVDGADLLILLSGWGACP